MITEVDGADGPVRHVVLRAARRRWPIVIGAVVLTLGLGLGVATQLPHKYTAVAAVLVNSVPSDASDPTKPKTVGLVAMSTEAQIAGSSLVRAAAVKRLPAGIRPAVISAGVVSVVTDTRVLRFSVTTHKKATSTAAASAYAQGYLDNRLATAQSYVAGQTTKLTGQIQSLQKQVGTVTAERNAAPDKSAERQTLSLRLKALNADLDTAQISLVTLAASPVSPGTLIQAATSAQRTGPTPVSVIGVSLLLGLLLGLGLATLRERTDQRLLDPGDLQDDLGIPLLAELPAPRVDGAIVDPDGAAADAYRALRNEIFLGPNPPGVLAISRVDAGTGTGDVTANLAILLARSGRRVCVIDTDTGPGQRLEAMLEGVDRVGLVHAGPDGTLVEPGIAVVTQREGLGQAKLGDILASPLFSRLVDATRQEAEVVLIDAPPVLTSAGQAVLATTDAVVLVVTKRLTRRRDVHTAEARIRRAGSRLVGTALRDPEDRTRGPVRRPGRRASTAPQPALPPPERPALRGGFSAPGAQQAAHLDQAWSMPSGDRAARAGGPTVYQPREPFAPEPAAAGTDPWGAFTAPSGSIFPTPSAGPGATPGPSTGPEETVAAPVGWPGAHRQAPSEPAWNAPTGAEAADLGWPDAQPMLAGAVPPAPNADAPGTG